MKIFKIIFWPVEKLASGIICLWILNYFFKWVVDNIGLPGCPPRKLNIS